MKKLILLSLITFSMQGILQATIITVDNNANSPADYSDLQTAIDAAAAGDTIYVAGSDDAYGDINVTKSSVLIGSGFNPYVGPAAKLGDVYFVNDGTANGSNSAISGFYLSGRVRSESTNSGAITDILISRVRTIGVWLTNLDERWLIENNIIKGNQGIRTNINSVANDGATEVIIRNNIYHFTPNGAAFDSRSSTNIIENNIVIMDFGFNNARIIGTTSSMTIRNNIFLGDGLNLTCENCQLSNNIFQSYSEGWSNTPPTFNPQIETEIGFINYPGTGFSYEDDFRLQTSSPAKTAGSFNTEIGIYGGVSPFPIGDLESLPTSVNSGIPLINQLDVLNAAPKDGTITINLKAKISN